MNGPGVSSTRLAVGCMTGTSIDALDAALVEIKGVGPAMSARVLATHTAPLDALRPRLRALADQAPMTAGETAALSREFSLLHARAAREMLTTAGLGGKRPDLVCVHGQTVFHAPPVSWQMITAPVIAHELKTPVVFDLRAADIAAGGQGAPITPIADWVLFRRHGDPMTVLNLGGFCNFTSWFTDMSPDEVRPAGRDDPDIRGGDICVCNQLLDSLARRLLHREYDEDGRAAMAGVEDAGASASLHELLSRQAAAGRSLGTGDELAAWSGRFAHLPASTLLRSACEAIAETIVRRVGADVPIVAAGGGAKNQALMGALRRRAQGDKGLRTTDDLGVPIGHREAVCFAVLGALCQDRVPITIPAVTGVPTPAPVSGVWVFGP